MESWCSTHSCSRTIYVSDRATFSGGLNSNISRRPIEFGHWTHTSCLPLLFHHSNQSVNHIKCIQASKIFHKRNPKHFNIFRIVNPWFINSYTIVTLAVATHLPLQLEPRKLGVSNREGIVERNWNRDSAKKEKETKFSISPFPAYKPHSHSHLLKHVLIESNNLNSNCLWT